MALHCPWNHAGCIICAPVRKVSAKARTATSKHLQQSFCGLRLNFLLFYGFCTASQVINQSLLGPEEKGNVRATIARSSFCTVINLFAVHIQHERHSKYVCSNENGLPRIDKISTSHLPDLTWGNHTTYPFYYILSNTSLLLHATVRRHQAWHKVSNVYYYSPCGNRRQTHVTCIEQIQGAILTWS